jgi:hypothetical protein
VNAFVDEIARTKLGEHERRLDDHETKLDKVLDKVSLITGIAMALTVLLTVVANALVVHYLTPTGPTAPPAAAIERSGR